MAWALQAQRNKYAADFVTATFYYARVHTVSVSSVSVDSA